MFPSLATPALSRYPSCYGQARKNLLQALEALPHPLDHRAVAHGGKGAEGESLYTDLVWIGPEDAENLLVLISATHGAEGFAGAAIQHDVLQQLMHQALPDNLALLIVHALNPWGFSHLRRVNEDGIDLNRNGADFSQPLPLNSDYDTVAEWLLPQDGQWRNANEQLHNWYAQWGDQRFRQAVAGGQYQHPEGLFYGGLDKSFSRQLIEEGMQRWRLHDRQVVVLDLHTGLGPFGHGELICDHPATSPASQKAQRWFGHWVTLPELGDSCSVPLVGLMDYLWHDAMREDGLYLTLEYGTYSFNRLLEGLRRDHWLYARPLAPDFSDPEQAAIRRELAEIFNPQSRLWRESMLLRARQVINIAWQRLQSQEVVL